jgi:hypothetical protein
MLTFGPDLTIRLRSDSAGLWGAERGIDTDGAHENYSHWGSEWTRATTIRSGGSEAEATLRVAGSGSRSLAKRSFHVGLARGHFILARDTIDAITLRADASPNAFLRNTYNDSVACQTGANVDVQPERAVRLELNGRYWGLYRAMAKNNKTWIRSLGHGAPVDIMEGPGTTAISGDPDRYTHALEVLREGAAIDTLARLFDLGSLIDLACLDLYTGRADHDLNVRCWRPRALGGRWRWILYDMDLWAPPAENSVERMLAGPADESPFVPALFRHPVLRKLLLQRMTALLSTILSPERSLVIADDIYRANAALLLEDHQRWQEQMPVLSPEEGIGELRTFVEDRPQHLLAFLARAADRDTATREVAVEPAQSGSLLLEGLPLTDNSATVIGLDGIPLRLEAQPSVGFEFVGWKGISGSGPVVMIDPGRTGRVRAVFRPVAWSRGHGLQQAGE